MTLKTRSHSKKITFSSLFKNYLLQQHNGVIFIGDLNQNKPLLEDQQNTAMLLSFALGFIEKFKDTLGSAMNQESLPKQHWLAKAFRHWMSQS